MTRRRHSIKAATFTDLPKEVLEAVLRDVDTADKVRLFSTCKALWRLGSDHALFFHSVRVRVATPSKQASLLHSWLGERQPVIRQLVLHETLTDVSTQRHFHSRESCVGALRAPIAMAGCAPGATSPLTSLTWSLSLPNSPCDHQLHVHFNWELGLPRLQLLHVHAPAHVTLCLGGARTGVCWAPGFAQGAPFLRALHVSGECSIQLHRQCLPRSLTSLQLDLREPEQVWLNAPLRAAAKLRALRLPAPLGGAVAPGNLRHLRSLTRLDLCLGREARGYEADGSSFWLLPLESLSPLTTLRALTLEACLPTPPASWSQLLPLTRLTCVVLRGALQLREHSASWLPWLAQLPGLRRLTVEPATREVCQGIHALSQLTFLALRTAPEERVPAALWEHPPLQQLDVAWSKLEGPLPEPPVGQQLTRLALHARQAARHSTHLLLLPHLRSLSLHGVLAGELPRAERRALLHALCVLPELGSLRVSKGVGQELLGLLERQVPEAAMTLHGRHVQFTRLKERSF